MQTQIEALKIQLDQLESELESMECTSKKKKTEKESVSLFLEFGLGFVLFFCYQIFMSLFGAVVLLYRSRFCDCRVGSLCIFPVDIIPNCH